MICVIVNFLHNKTIAPKESKNVKFVPHSTLKLLHFVHLKTVMEEQIEAVYETMLYSEHSYLPLKPHKYNNLKQKVPMVNLTK